MPFGLQKTALVLDWESAAHAASGGWKVEWNHPLRSRRMITVDGHEVEVLEFDAVEESLLLVPLSLSQRKTSQEQPLAGSSAWAMVSLEPGENAEKTVRELYKWLGDAAAPCLGATRTCRAGTMAREAAHEPD
jgi:hypothetical protein